MMVSLLRDREGERRLMVYYVAKVVITALLIVLISEIAKRSTFWGAVLASLPLVSVLAMVWIYIDTKEIERIGIFATSVFWLVLASLPFFLILPAMLKGGIGFYPSIVTSLGVSALCYWGMVTALNHYGIKL